jgi:hypothetical protein
LETAGQSDHVSAHLKTLDQPTFLVAGWTVQVVLFWSMSVACRSEGRGQEGKKGKHDMYMSWGVHQLLQKTRSCSIQGCQVF